MMVAMALAPLFASATAVQNVMQSYVSPIVATIVSLASLASVFFLIVGGFQYMTSSGDPEKLGRAKSIIKNALIGLALVIAAAAITAILNNAYSGASGPVGEQLPTLQNIENIETDSGIVDVLIKSVVGLLRKVVESAAEPFLKSLSYFINSTPLMGNNPHVFNLWLAIVGITDVLFVLVVALLGFQVMSFSTFGFEELDIRHLIPRLGLGFLLINVSIFAIDGLISLSNAMIYALQSGFQSTDIWAVLISITQKSSDMGIAGLLVMVAFLVLTVMLLVYYIMRLVTLYMGAILSPLVALLWLIPAFKDFAVTTLKAYLVTIFILFVHATVLILTASILVGLNAGGVDGQPNALMALMVGLATVLFLLKTQGFVQEVATVASIPRAAREMTGTFRQGVRDISSGYKTAQKGVKGTQSGAKKIKGVGVKLHKKVTSRSGGDTTSGSKSPKSGSTSRKAPTSSPKLKTGETRKAKPIKKKGSDHEVNDRTSSSNNR